MGPSGNPERVRAHAPEDFSIPEVEVVVMGRSHVRENLLGRRATLVHWRREFAEGEEGTAVTGHEHLVSPADARPARGRLEIPLERLVHRVDRLEHLEARRFHTGHAPDFP